MSVGRVKWTSLLLGDDLGEHYLHKFAMFLYGGEGSIHPVVLAPPADLAAWSFRWERMIQSTVAHQLSENGGDTVGGCVVVGFSRLTLCIHSRALRAKHFHV